MRKHNYAKYIKGETALHVQCIEYLNFFPSQWRYHHSPNEGKRTPFQQYVMSITGVSSGFPDLMIYSLQDKRAHQAIELKWENNVPTNKQLEWLSFFMEKTSCDVWVCWSFDAFRKIIDNTFQNTEVANLNDYFVLKSDLLPSKIKKLYTERK